MSHFVGLVFGFDHEELLEPYDENREVDVYVKYTKDEAINVVRTRRIEDYEWALKVLEKHPNPESDWEKNHVQHAQKIIEEGFEISYENAWEEAKNGDTNGMMKITFYLHIILILNGIGT